MVVLDYYAVQPRATLQCFKDSGATGTAHYLTASMSDPREINRQELEDSLAVGLEVYLVYEMNPTYAGYFTFAQGVQDCLQAMARLDELGMPDGTVVYFTVDVNINPNLVVEYFNGIESVATPRIVPGGYGFQSFCEFAYREFPGIGKHLWQTYGAKTVPLDMWQRLQEDRCGVEVDVNDAYVHGITKGETVDPVTHDEFEAWKAKFQEQFVAPTTNTLTAIKDALALLAAHQDASAGDIAAGATAQLLASLTKILTNTAPPVPPSCPPGTKYFGESADGSVVGFTYPDGTTHYFRNGVEAHA